MDFFRNCFHLGKIGVQVLLDVNVAGHPVSSAASLDLLGGRLRGRAARQISFEFFAGTARQRVRKWPMASSFSGFGGRFV